MKISEVDVQAVLSFLRLDEEDADTTTLSAAMGAAKSYISSYTGIPAVASETTAETLDVYEDLTIAYLILIQDMYDNRAFSVDKANVNRTVESILNMHERNLL